MLLPLIVLLTLLAPAAAFADAPNGAATFSMPAASFPLVDLDGPLAGGLPLDLAFTDGKLGDVDVEFLATLTQGEDGKITGTATLDEAAGSPVVLDLTCEVSGKVRGKGLSTKLIIKVPCEGEIDTGLGFGLRAGEATLKLV